MDAKKERIFFRGTLMGEDALRWKLYVAGYDDKNNGDDAEEED